MSVLHSLKQYLHKSLNILVSNQKVVWDCFCINMFCRQQILSQLGTDRQCFYLKSDITLLGNFLMPEISLLCTTIRGQSSEKKVCLST
jgi:hypothetical protein